MTAALVLDLDGTLLDTPGAIAATLGRVLAELGGPVAPGRIRATVGKPLDTSVADLLGVAVDDPLVDRAVTRYRQLFAAEVVPRASEIVLPGVAAGLAAATRAGLGLAIATSKVRASATALLDAAGLAPLLGPVVCHDMVEHGKPAPDLALRAADLLAAAPGGCVVVGDGVDDMRMARAAGMVALGVTTGVGDATQLAAAGAHRVVEDFDAVIDMVLANRPTFV